MGLDAGGGRVMRVVCGIEWHVGNVVFLIAG
jgi:hypothetical protein